MSEKKSSQAQIDASVRYNKSRDNIMLRPTDKGGKQIREAAAAAGKPVQRFILDIVYDAIGYTPEK